jgi:hypothetical protein
MPVAHTDISPAANNHIVATVTPIQRNNSKTDSRIIPIAVAKNLIKHNIEQMVANTNQTPADFLLISEPDNWPVVRLAFPAALVVRWKNAFPHFIPENPS